MQKMQGQVVFPFLLWRREKASAMEAVTYTFELPFFQKALDANRLTSGKGEAAE